MSKVSATPKPLQVSSSVTRSVLKNGATIMSKETGAAISTVKITLQCGSQDETAGQKGAAHLISKSAFAGAGSVSGLRLVRGLENEGVIFGASADRTEISFVFSCLADKVASAFPLVSQAVVAAPPLHVLKEVDNVGEEYEAVAADPNMQLKELLYEAAFGKSSPLGAPRLAAAVDEVAAEQVLQFRSQHFVSSKLHVSAAGVAHAQLEDLVTRYLSLPQAAAPAASPSPYKGGSLEVRANVGGTYFALGFPVVETQLTSYQALCTVLEQHAAAHGWSVTPFLGQGLFGLLSSSTDHLAAAVAALDSIAAGSSSVSVNKTLVQLALAQEDLGSQGVSALSSSAPAAPTAASVAGAAKAARSVAPAYVVLGDTSVAPTAAAFAAKK